MEYRTRILEGKGLDSARALRPSLRLVPNFGERLGRGRKSERKSIGQTKLIFKLKSNYRHGLYLYKSKVFGGDEPAICPVVKSARAG
jgi:hypothetical protein